MHTKEASSLFEGLGAEARHLEKVAPCTERTVGGTQCHDAFRQRGADARDVGEQFGAGGVDIHSHGVDARRHDLFEGATQGVLVDIMLVLAHAQRAGVDLDEFGQRVHEPAPDGYGPAHSDVVVGEFCAGDLGGGVDRGPALIHEGHRHMRWKPGRLDEGFGLAPRCTVADGHRFDAVPCAKVTQGGGGAGRPVSTGEGVDDLVVQQCPLRVEAYKLGPGAPAGVECECASWPHRRGQ